MINETTTYAVTIASTRAAFLRVASVGIPQVATCAPTAFVRGSTLPVAGHVDLGARKALAQIPNRDVAVVMTDGTSGFRTWSPPV